MLSSLFIAIYALQPPKTETSLVVTATASDSKVSSLAWIKKTNKGFKLEPFGQVDLSLGQPYNVVAVHSLCGVVLMQEELGFKLHFYPITDSQMGAELASFQSNSGFLFEILGPTHILMFGKDHKVVKPPSTGMRIETLDPWKDRNDEKWYPEEVDRAKRAVAIMDVMGVSVANVLYSFSKNEYRMLLEPYRHHIGAFNSDLTRLVVITDVKDEVLPVLYSLDKREKIAVLGSKPVDGIEVAGGLIVVAEKSDRWTQRMCVYDEVNGRFLGSFQAYCIGSAFPSAFQRRQ